MKSGSQYSKYIAQSNCEVFDLGNGDTFHTVDNMKEWVYTYYHHVTRLSKKLRKKTLPSTIRSIHKFLYSHITYKQDGLDQVIKSPGCTWATRDQGTDCKTFSVFASCLLYNMNIPHAIRQVKQPGSNSNLWTHVYIVVPVNPKDKKIKGDYYVLDGTVANNREVRFVKKNDEFMLPHTGLGSPGIGYQPTYMGLSGEATKGFEAFLKMLSDVNVTSNTVNAIRNAVTSYTQQGIDPPFQINAEGVVVGTTLYPYISRGNRSQGIKNAWDYVEKNISKGLSNAQNNNQGDGQTIEQVAAEVVKSGFFQRTFGAVFANGFDLSCFGSATNEQKMTQNVSVDLPYYLDRSGLKQSASITSIRKFFYEIEVYRFGAQVLEKPKFAKCTRKAGKLGKEATQAFIDYMVGAIDGTLAIQNKRLVRLPNRSEGGPHEVPTKSGRGGGSIRLGETLSVLDFRIEAIPNTQQVPAHTPAPPVVDTPPVQQITKPSSNTSKPKPVTTTAFSSNSSGSSASKGGGKPTVQTASFGTVGKVLLGTGVAFGLVQLYNSTKANQN